MCDKVENQDLNSTVKDKMSISFNQDFRYAAQFNVISPLSAN